MRLYFDNNVYNRPFDDLNIPRNLDEARAVETLLERIQVGGATLVSSFVVEIENSLSPSDLRREEVGALIGMAKEHVMQVPVITRRARTFEGLGLKARDALHLAAAEHAGVEWFVTCDDRHSKKAKRIEVSVRVVSPLELLEVV